MLQQAPTFKELMREPCAFFEIADRTGQHNIVHIMAWIVFSAAQRNRMLNMKDVFPIFLLKFGRTIIAGIALAFQFAFYLLSGQRTFYCALLYFTFMVMGAMYHPTAFSTAISLHLLLYLFFIGLIAFPALFGRLFFMGPIVQVVILSVLFSMGFLLIPPTSYAYLFPVSGAANPLSLSLLIFMSLIILLLIDAHLFFMRFPVSVPALIYLFCVGFAMRLLIGFFASLADCNESAFVYIEKFRSCRKELLAFASTLLSRGIVLWYHVHEKVYSFSGLGCFQHRQASSCFDTSLYHKSPLQANLGGING